MQTTQPVTSSHVLAEGKLYFYTPYPITSVFSIEEVT